jgi:hypothetical protein
MSGKNQPENPLSPQACKALLELPVSEAERIQLVYEAGRKAGIAEQHALLKQSPVGVRRMKTPPPSGPIPGERIAERMMAICRCKGQYDCECVSVHNEARSQLWYEHNTGEPAPTR